MTSEEYYELASDAVRRQKFSRAMDYFIKSLEKEPEFVDARRGLRAVSVNQFDGKKFPALMSGISILAQICLAKAKKKYDEGLVLCERFLCKDPTHVWTLKQMLSFAEAKEYKATLCHVYSVLGDLCPDDADLVIDAADFLSEQGSAEHFERAVSLMSQLCKAYPDDTDLSTERNRIEAKKVVYKLEGDEDKLRNKDQAKELEQESQQIKTADDLENAIVRATERDKKENSARSKEVLADLIFRKGELMDAIELFKKSIELDPNNQSVHSRLGDAKIKLISDQLSNMENRLSTLDGKESDALKVLIKEKAKELQETKMAEYNRRLKINPNDLKTRYEVGLVFYKAKAFDKAINQFQKSVQDARLSFRSSHYLGHCYKNINLLDMAIREFENASKKPGANGSERLGAIYEAALCYELSEKYPEALDLFKSILEKDFGFKDVASRVEGIQKRSS